MKIHASSIDCESSNYLTIYITGYPEDWHKLNEIIKEKNNSNIEMESSKDKSDDLEKYDGKYLNALRINIENSVEDSRFRIQIIDDILMFNGARESFDNFNDLASEFSRNSDMNGSHVHLDYIDIDGYEYNWFCNKNIELILGVEPRA